MDNEELIIFPTFQVLVEDVTEKIDVPKERHLKKMKAQRRVWFKKRDSGEVEK